MLNRRFTPALLIPLLCLAACSSKQDSGVISREDMFPPPSAFSADCTLNERVSDAVAVQIAKGQYDDTGGRTAANSNAVQCVYRNPNVTVTVSIFEDAKSCKETHLKEGVAVAKKLEGYREIDSIGEDAYIAEFGGETLGFRYGNLSVVLILYDEARRDEIVEVLKEHYASVVQ